MDKALGSTRNSDPELLLFAIPKSSKITCSRCLNIFGMPELFLKSWQLLCGSGREGKIPAPASAPAMGKNPRGGKTWIWVPSAAHPGTATPVGAEILGFWGVILGVFPRENLSQVNNGEGHQN